MDRECTEDRVASVFAERDAGCGTACLDRYRGREGSPVVHGGIRWREECWKGPAESGVEGELVWERRVLGRR